MVLAFCELPLLFGGDFSVTLKARDRPNAAGGRDPGSEEFLSFHFRDNSLGIGPYKLSIHLAKLDRAT